MVDKIEFNVLRYVALVFVVPLAFTHSHEKYAGCNTGIIPILSPSLLYKFRSQSAQWFSRSLITHMQKETQKCLPVI